LKLKNKFFSPKNFW